MFEQEILPGIQEIPLAELQRATGLSHTYVSAIRRGKYVPHPQHWPAFRRLTEHEKVTAAGSSHQAAASNIGRAT